MQARELGLHFKCNNTPDRRAPTVAPLVLKCKLKKRKRWRSINGYLILCIC